MPHQSKAVVGPDDVKLPCHREDLVGRPVVFRLHPHAVHRTPRCSVKAAVNAHVRLEIGVSIRAHGLCWACKGRSALHPRRTTRSGLHEGEVRPHLFRGGTAPAARPPWWRPTAEWPPAAGRTHALPPHLLPAAVRPAQQRWLQLYCLSVDVQAACLLLPSMPRIPPGRQHWCRQGAWLPVLRGPCSQQWQPPAVQAPLLPAPGPLHSMKVARLKPSRQPPGDEFASK
jgi:hypothetical protein